MIYESQSVTMDVTILSLSLSRREFINLENKNYKRNLLYLREERLCNIRLYPSTLEIQTILINVGATSRNSQIR